VRRLNWSRERIEAEQTRALRRLLTHAAQNSPWHGKRLGQVDLGRITPADLASIPTMTKHDLMANWDEILTDRRITRAAAETHLGNLKWDAYFRRVHHVIASGGSSGTRGIFIVDWHGWAAAFAGFGRGIFVAQRELKLGSPVSIAAESPAHATSALAQTFSTPWRRVTRLPVSLPLDEIVSGLNQAAPSFLHCYPSFVPALCAEARAGRLRIAPKAVWCTSEPLLPEVRQLAEGTWGATVLNSWGASESNGGTFACQAGGGFHISEDLNLIEAVDAEGRPVARGERSERIYLTNFSNRVQPLIRYEISDEFRVLDGPCACGSAYLKVADVLGRADDVFHYAGGLVVHPLAFRSVLGKEPSVLEFQVRQTEVGAVVVVVTESGLQTAALERSLTESLRRVGLAEPAVQVRTADAIPRSEMGKLTRFVALSDR
jgi:phenylacetate-CoA ligase